MVLQFITPNFWVRPPPPPPLNPCPVLYIDGMNYLLQEDLASKMQQVKQYKKQKDHHVLELVTFKEAYDIQKLQVSFENDAIGYIIYSACLA